MNGKPLALNWQALGESDRPPLVILHGFLASGRNWLTIAKALSDRFWVLLPDLRNHGASPHHPIMDYPVMAADMLGLLDRLELPEAAVLGHSMGGKVAMWVALNHPERVSKLLVADISPKKYTHDFNDILTALKALPLASLSSRKQADEHLRASIAKPSLRQFLLQNLKLEDGSFHWRVDLDILRDAGPMISGFPDSTGYYPYSDETLFVFGEQSGFLDQAAIQSLFPSATISMIAEAGHWLHAEQPVRFLEIVGRFLVRQ